MSRLLVERAPSGPLSGAVVAPHHLAARAGAEVLAEGGNAIEAMIAAAASIAVVYPHMNGLGGDGFWLLQAPGEPAQAIEACGYAVAGADPAWYRERGLDTIPHRGGPAACTVAGTVAGWEVAHDWSRRHWGGRLPLRRLLETAHEQAVQGFAVSTSQFRTLEEKADELRGRASFESAFCPEGRIPAAGTVFRQPDLGAVLEQLGRAGCGDFYRGEIAATLAAGLGAQGSPLQADDLAGFTARLVSPLELATPVGALLNLPPPTQGIASLLILGIYQQLLAKSPHPADGTDHVHTLVEATKAAFRVRGALVTDPDHLPEDPARYLTGDAIARLAAEVNPLHAAPWPSPPGGGDTVWLGAMDAFGNQVSFIQSLYHEFGSGVVAPGTGIVWQNRGHSFSLDARSLNPLQPGRRPFHTLNPAGARLLDGRSLVYGTMGGEGQPQTQAAIFSRAILHGQDLARAIASPRWLLGRTWGHGTDSLKVEDDLPAGVVAGLRARGHEVDVVPACNSMMGHAGLLLRDPEGWVHGASDPRCDGAVAGIPASDH
ncbi:MAG: gamma-glutamyltransferase [Thioalkalivibrio sp.]|nr:MAG: gamma-glutamyltransferase [Thioalkalivibrio sp.]